MNDCVITGIGMICSLGIGRNVVWRRLLDGSPRMRLITAFDAAKYGLEDCVVAQVDDHELAERKAALSRRGFVPNRAGRFRLLSLSAAVDALDDSCLPTSDADWQRGGGVFLGTMAAGAEELERMVKTTENHGKPLVSDNLGKRTSIAIQDIARAFELRGPMMGVDAACASGAVAVIHGCRLIGAGDAAWCLAGGVECSIVPSSIKLARSLGVVSTRYRDQPNRASRPFDLGRDGYVPAEGACFLLLENAQHAAARRARIYARVAGYADDIDTRHPTRLSPVFIERLMCRALERANVSGDRLGWVKAHATSTPQGDAAEAQAVASLRGDTRMPVSAPKSMTGHLLGCAGAMEMGFTAMSIAEQVIPPTVNLESQDPQCPVECITKPEHRAFTHVLANAFGFGGPGCSIVLQRATDTDTRFP